MAENGSTILDIRNLNVDFHSVSGVIHALRGVDITLRRGETVALVGESGSGKSVTMKTVMGLLGSNAEICSGEVHYYGGEDGKQEIDLLQKDAKWRAQHINGKEIAMVFQDPMTSLNPTMTIGNQLISAIRSHEKLSRKAAWERAVNYLREVGITEPERRMDQYPHEFSGGMRQRIVIAIALSGDPSVLICDEPTTALDVTIQDRVLDLIVSLQQTRGLSVIYITHDLGVVAKVADHVYVMYAGKVVERGTIFDIFYDPRHPYTWGLLSAIPDPKSSGELPSLAGTPPVLDHEITGDAFAPRNPYALEIDFKQEPPEFGISKTHFVRSWLADPRAPKVSMPETLARRIESMKKEAANYAKS